MTFGEKVIIGLFFIDISLTLIFRYLDRAKEVKLEEKADEVVEVLEQIADGVNEEETIVEEEKI